MSEKKAKKVQYVSPEGTALYPWLNTPDFKWKPEGEFKVTLRVAADEAAEYIAKIDAAIEAHRPTVMEALKDPKVRKSFKSANMLRDDGSPVVHRPYSMVENDAGEETGEVEFKFAMKHKVVRKKDNKEFTLYPTIFDAKRVELKNAPAIFGGSKLKIRSEFVPYFTVLAGLGVALRLDAVQIIELSTGRGATADGFAEEDGFEADGFAADAPAETGAEAKDDGSSDF